MGTYLEDYLESMYMLPSEIKRNFDLMRELDKTSYPLIEELKTAHKAYLIAARRKVVERCADKEKRDPDEQELRDLVEADATLELLKTKHQRVIQKLDEKIAIAAQSYDIVDHHIRRLDQDLDAYAALLKQNGEFEEEKALKKLKTKHGAASTSSSQTPVVVATTTKSSKQQAAASAASASSSSATTATTTTGTGRKRSATEAALEIPVVPAVLPVVSEDLPIDPNEPIYCNCRRVSYGQMVGCDNDDCKYEWFHFECVGLTDQPAGKWYCADCKIALGIK
ncbi:Ahpc/tsa family redoxin, partial [Globisporangium splendens]